MLISVAIGGVYAKKMREFGVRIVLLLLGLTIAHLGVTLFLLADLGADPFNVLVQGVYRFLSRTVEIVFLTHGRTHIAICFLIILVLLLIDRTYIKIGTLLCMSCGGPIIDFFVWALAPVFQGEMSFALRVIVNVLGCAILAFGMTIVIKSDAGTGPNDLVALVMSEKTGKKFSIIRVSVDFLFTFVGFLLGGSIGVGTVICMFVVGPVAGYIMPYSEKVVNHIIKAHSNKY